MNSGFDRSVGVGLLALGLLVLLIHINGLQNPFTLDDLSKIVDNPDIRSLKILWSRLIYPYETQQVLERNDPSRPLVFLVYGLLYAVNGADPLLFRITNMLFHGIASVGLWAAGSTFVARFDGNISRRKTLWMGWLMAVVFVMLPIQNGSVSYAYALSDLMMAAFVIWGLWTHVNDRSRWTRVFCVLALASKQSAVVFPALCVLSDVAYRRPSSQREWAEVFRRSASLFGLLTLYLLGRAFLLGGLGDLEGRGQTYDPWVYFFYQPAIIVRYLSLTIWPRHLSLDHFVGPRHVSAVEAGLAWVVVLVILTETLTRLRSFDIKTRGVRLCIGFYVLCLIPTSSFVPTVDLMVERRVYLANMGVAALLSLGGIQLVDRLSSGLMRNAVVAFFSFMLLGMGALSSARNKIFSSELSLWKNILEIYPESPRALNNLAMAYKRKGDLKSARTYLEVQAALYPADPVSLANLGSLSAGEGKSRESLLEAEKMLQKALALKPSYALAHYDLARVYQLLGRDEQAELHYREALRHQPRLVLAYNNLGILYFRKGDQSRALEELTKGLQIDPSHSLLQENLRLVENNSVQLRNLGEEVSVDEVDPQVILQVYLEALKSDPTNSNVRKNYEEFCKKRKLTCPPTPGLLQR